MTLRAAPMMKVMWTALVAFFLFFVPAFPALADTEPADAPQLGAQLPVLAPLPADFDSVQAAWITVEFPRSQKHWVKPLLSEAAAFKAEVSERLGQDTLTNVRVRLAEDPKQMALLAPIGAPYPKYAVGVAYSRLNLILLTLAPLHAGAEHDLQETFRHELAHLALHDAVASHRVPLWFNEGLAVHLSREKAFGRMQTLWSAAVSGNLMPLAEIERKFPKDVVGVPLAYAQSADVVRYLLRQEDSERFQLLIQRVRRGQEFDRALYDSYGMDIRGLEYHWREEVAGRYSIWPMLFSGTVIWVLAVGLAGVAWYRKRKREERTLNRWAKEEAKEDERLTPPAAKAPAPLQVWMVAAQSDSGSGGARSSGPRRESSPSLPKVEHDGSWHTLH